jgi:SAM-dependent methyltransferase
VPACSVVAPRRTPFGRKYQAVARLLGDAGVTSVLDVGCRDCVLAKALANEGVPAAYTGLDLYQNAAGSVDLVCDLSAGIPADDEAFDAVVALDVMEHLDDLRGGLAELVRVARRRVVVVLPNLAHFWFRGQFLRHGRLSGKYDLAIDQGQDRHRWLTVAPQTDAFMAAFAARAGLSLHTEDLAGSRRTRPMELALRAVGAPRAWHAWAVLYVLAKERPPSS